MPDNEVIDVDADMDVFQCTSTRPCTRTDRPPSPPRSRVVISIDSDSEDKDSSIVASSRLYLPPKKSHSPTGSRPRSTVSPCTELQHITQLELSRRVLCHGPPATQKTFKMIQVTVNHNKLKRKQSTQEVIEISSDSEPETLPYKRPKLEDVGSPYHADGASGNIPKSEAESSRAGLRSPSSSGNIPKSEAESSHAGLRSPSSSDGRRFDSDDDDYVDFLAALDISNETNWIPLPERNRAEDLTPMHDSGSTPKPPSLPSYLLRKKSPVDRRRLPLQWDLVGPWGMISNKNYGINRFPKPFHRARRPEHLFPRRSPNLYYETGYSKLELTAKYPHLTSGSVNKIIQAQDTVVLCAAVTGGLDDDDDDDDDDRPPPPPENRLGSLVVFHHGRVHMVPAHCRPCKTSRGSTMKYYSVNDVVFNPFNPKQFLSSGCDLAIQAWDILDPDGNDECQGLNEIRKILFDSRPQDLLYAPDGSALAVTFYDGIVRLYSQDLFEDMVDAHFPHKKFFAAPKGSGHATGSTLWGKESSKNLLFTSSEPWERSDFSGFHHAFDTYRGTQAIQFDATESGDAAAISPDGTTLVLFTWGKDKTHPIRLYDVHRKEKMAYETGELEKFRVRPSSDSDREPCDLEEVNQASFSPDGRLLAVARNDNVLHVYDVRALSRGPLCHFAHHDSDTVKGGEFGVVGVEWVQGRDRIGIVSGGDDGCVRLWEPALGNTNEVQGAVIGRTDFDVAHFSVGDQQDGELPLIIGDCGGGMHTYDFTNEDGIQIL